MPRRRKQGAQIGNDTTVKHKCYRSDKYLTYDGRTQEAIMRRTVSDRIVEAIGGREALSPQRQLIIDRLSFKAVRCALAEAALMRSNGNSSQRLKDDYLRWSHSLREDLKLLGMERKSKDVTQSLERYVQETYPDEVNQ